MKLKLRLVCKGGAGSGNFGHAGRPGLVGGSASSGRRAMIQAINARERQQAIESSGLSSRQLDAMQSYVIDPDAMTLEQRRVLVESVIKATTDADTLYRIQANDRFHETGDVFVFTDITSFTTVDITGGRSAGQLGWKDSDEALYRIDNPSKGLDIVYGAINTPFNAAAEHETLVVGSYVVVSKTLVTQPGYPEGYVKIPLYVIRELI